MTITLNAKELTLVREALEISAAFKVYGEGRQEHQEKVAKVLAKLTKGRV